MKRRRESRDLDHGKSVDSARMDRAETKTTGGGDTQPVLRAFESFRDEIDAYNDRRERLIKTSRDVTSLAKKIIFHLHRFTAVDAWPCAPDALPARDQKLLADAHAKLADVVGALQTCAQTEGLVSTSPDAPSPANLHFESFLGASLEEMMEAASFLYFLENGTVMPLAHVQDMLRTESGDLSLYISPNRYLLGLSDLTGELMRFAINAVTAREPQRIIDVVLHTQRTIYKALEPVVPYSGGIRKKQQVTLSSLRKVEDTAYTIRVRTAEYGDDHGMIQEMVRRALADRAEE
ncbi:hypothetical protein MSPP1_001111 [Malassezia sp. CBS 17886]|nr:hypothetical protein MSPP1_001111 [Malassezia sp. CBS 17886]